MRFGTLGPPHEQESLRDAIRNRQLEEARRAGWPELDRADLTFGKHFIEHTSGDLFLLHRGELTDSVYAGTAAFFLSERGEILFLERPPAGMPQTRDELVAVRAEREHRRNAPKPRRQGKHR